MNEYVVPFLVPLIIKTQAIKYHDSDFFSLHSSVSFAAELLSVIVTAAYDLMRRIPLKN
ncbi:MAG: hypothetical protein VZR11_05490 [Succinimonas sp.]|nr:hypothetical protein [Succinimonas sp.]